MLLTEDNFLWYAAKFYDNPGCVTMDEFEDDLLRFKYLKKLLYTYKQKGILKERLLLNHFVVLYNVFEPHACTRMVCLKLNEYLDCVFPFLSLLGYLPKKIDGVYTSEFILETKNVVMDKKVIDNLKNILRNTE